MDMFKLKEIKNLLMTFWKQMLNIDILADFLKIFFFHPSPSSLCLMHHVQPRLYWSRKWNGMTSNRQNVTSQGLKRPGKLVKELSCSAKYWKSKWQSWIPRGEWYIYIYSLHLHSKCILDVNDPGIIYSTE